MYILFKEKWSKFGLFVITFFETVHYVKWENSKYSEKFDNL